MPAAGGKRPRTQPRMGTAQAHRQRLPLLLQKHNTRTVRREPVLWRKCTHYHYSLTVEYKQTARGRRRPARLPACKCNKKRGTRAPPLCNSTPPSPQTAAQRRKKGGGPAPPLARLNYVVLAYTLGASTVLWRQGPGRVHRHGQPSSRSHAGRRRAARLKHHHNLPLPQPTAAHTTRPRRAGPRKRRPAYGP